MKFNSTQNIISRCEKSFMKHYVPKATYGHSSRRFFPARRNGIAVEGSVDVPISFKLTDK